MQIDDLDTPVPVIDLDRVEDIGGPKRGGRFWSTGYAVIQLLFVGRFVGYIDNRH